MFGQYSPRSNGGTRHDSSLAHSLATGERVKAVFDNRQTAHVWAQLTQSFGKSSNGNLFFTGRALFSYGSHFVAGLILPEPGETFESTSRGVVLINADKNSVTTAGHVSDARAAARGRSFHVPGLTEIHKILEQAERRETYSTKGERFADLARAALSERFLTQDDATPERAALFALFAACGVKDPEKVAEKVAAQAARKQADRAAKVKADALARVLSDAKGNARIDPTREAARIKRRAIESGSWSYDAERVEREGREVFRAYKAAKGKGWTRVAAANLALYRAMRESLPEFLKAETRRNRLRAWADRVAKVRAGLRPATPDELADPSRYRGDGGPNRSGVAVRASALHAAANAARDLAAYLGGPVPQDATNESAKGCALRSARLAGVDSALTSGRLLDLAERFEREAANADKDAARDLIRKQVASLRAARDLSPDATPAQTVAALAAAENVADRFAPQHYSGRATYETPAPFRVAGFGPQVFAALLADYRPRLKTARAAIQEESRLAAIERNRVERERQERERADALPLWRAGERSPHMPNRDPEGRAYLRAVGVERDESGVIVGGTLQTSQGAAVPLTHAVKVFRFLKLCRDKGEAWAANGRTVRVGPFTLDSVAPSGDFVAGCHRIAWGEVATLAASLGLSDLTPQDAREPAHA